MQSVSSPSSHPWVHLAHTPPTPPPQNATAPFEYVLRIRPDVVYLRPLPYQAMVTPTTLTTFEISRVALTYFWGGGWEHEYFVVSDQLWFVERERAPDAFTRLIPSWCRRHVSAFRPWGPEVEFGKILNGSRLYLDKRRDIQLAIARAVEVPEVTLDCNAFGGHGTQARHRFWAPDREDPAAKAVGR